MIRAVAEGIFLFCLPYLLFSLWLVSKGENPLDPGRWSRRVLSNLTLVALGLCILAVVLVGAFRQQGQGAYVPSQMRDGVFVPGHFRTTP
jgi:Family of unknown function (DUF6111)